MGILEDIRNKLKAGSTRAQLIEQGYASSSVYRETRLLNQSSRAKPKNLDDSGSNSVRPSVPSIPAALYDDEEIIQLQKEVVIAELEAKLKSTKSKPYSPAVIDFYRSMQRQGYSGTIRSLIDKAVATIIVDHLVDGIDTRLRKWAQDLAGINATERQAPKSDAVEGLIETLYESARLEMVLQNWRSQGSRNSL